ncbi:AsnC family transcriptional regulator [Agaricicola taiwanensis]|uniref:AsnC family transcriptional regulator n=1 Tax=Agaricicola taiwanensis TaxID=591372 RepID=A0A8J3DZD7_9RHOB|nr:Lrp/AsnC ligand binding domain-containing protein [Agaricicola taiwanensis]GGE51326.1 AsnC family transcriptional regulator [Agaricicola taiwanensis]
MLDKIDLRLLQLLQDDGRMTTTELADRVGLGPTATSERVRRLTREGYITGFHARLDPTKVGLGLLVFIEVKLDRTTPEVFEDFAAAVRRAPEVLECHMVSGGFDYLIKSRIEDMSAYRRFLGEILVALPGVKETHTYPVMEEVKNIAGLPL